MAKVDEVVTSKGERPIVQRGADGAQDLVGLLLAPCGGPDVQRDDMLSAILAGCRPVACRGLAECKVGKRCALGHVVKDAPGAEQRGERGIGREGGEDRLLE